METDHLKHWNKKKKNKPLCLPHMCIFYFSFSLYEYINTFPSNVPDPSSCPLFNLHSWKWGFVPEATVRSQNQIAFFNISPWTRFLNKTSKLCLVTCHRGSQCKLMNHHREYLNQYSYIMIIWIPWLHMKGVTQSDKPFQNNYWTLWKFQFIALFFYKRQLFSGGNLQEPTIY